MHFPIFFCFLRPLRSSLTNAFFFSNEDEQWLGLYCHEAQACQMSLSNSQNQVQKWSPSRANYSRGCSKSPIRCSSALAGVSFNSLVRLTERNKCHGRLPLVDAIMSTCLVSKYSAYWPDIWAEYNLNRFYDRKLKSLRNNASARNTNNRVFAKVRFRNLLSKIVPKVRFAVIFCIKGKNVLHRR